MNKIGLSLLLFAMLFTFAGCAPFTAKPSEFTFQGSSWKVSSAEIVDEFASIKPASESDALLVVTYLIQSEPRPKDEGMSLAWAFSNIALKDPNRTPNNIETGFTEDGNFINLVRCVYAVAKGTKSVELVLSSSQTIEITVNR